MEWINVKDELPEIEKDVFFYYGKETCYGCLSRNLQTEDTAWLNITGEGYDVVSNERVTHWMPKPEPPKP